AGIEEASLRALAKLEQVLPSGLRQRVGALHGATLSLPGAGPAVDPEVLSTIAATVRARERLRFDYEPADGTAGLKTVEPQRLGHAAHARFLAGHDRRGLRCGRTPRAGERATCAGGALPPRG